MAYITKRGDKWRAQIRRVDSPSISKTFRTKAMAEAWARRTETELDAGKVGATITDDSIAELVHRYTTEIGKNKDFGRTKAAALAFLADQLGSYTIQTLTKDELLEYVKGRIASKVSGVTVSIELTYLAAVYRAAKFLWGMEVDLDIFSVVRSNMAMLNISTRSKERKRRVSDAELKKLLEYFDTRPNSKVPYSDIIMFSIKTTMRAGEIVALRWEDLDEKNKTIVIRSRKHPTDKEFNDQVVPLINGAFEIIMKQPRVHDRIFPIQDGTISSVFPRATTALGIDDLRFHDLRHEGISRLFDAGFTIEQVSVFSGHFDWKSLKRYTHLSAAQLHAIAEVRLGNLPRPEYQQSEDDQPSSPETHPQSEVYSQSTN